MRQVFPFVLSGLITFSALEAVANETDQYSLPIGRDFADLRGYFTKLVYDDVAAATARVNRDIEASLKDGQPSERTERLQSADHMGSVVWGYLFRTFPSNGSLDAMLHSKFFRDRYPGMLTAYRAETSIYDHPGLVIDITKIIRVFFRASTVNIDGTLLGTDKLIHFLQLGRIYHSSYVKALDDGFDTEEARVRAVKLSAGHQPLLSESGFLGMVTTGVRSNADLASDYAGFRFYLNITEEIQWRDRRVPPMLVRDGHYWRLNEQVNPYSDFFVQFISPHWNEALNYNIYAFYTDNLVGKMVQQRCPDLLDKYLDPRGNRRNRQQFEALEEELSTLYGEDYGWRSEGDEAISIANLCFEEDTEAETEVETEEDTGPQAVPDTEVAGPDRFNRSELWWAANEGELDAVQDLLAQGADPNAMDFDGETPLHAAARLGDADIVATLLDHGADPGALALYDTTPLHISVRDQRVEVTRQLLEQGADANALDGFGHAPLHDAALRNDLRSARLLLASGADAGLKGTAGQTPLDLAERAGDQTMLNLLASR
jgi:hypothetical protein